MKHAYWSCGKTLELDYFKDKEYYVACVKPPHDDELHRYDYVCKTITNRRYRYANGQFRLREDCVKLMKAERSYINSVLYAYSTQYSTEFNAMRCIFGDDNDDNDQ